MELRESTSLSMEERFRFVEEGRGLDGAVRIVNDDDDVEDENVNLVQIKVKSPFFHGMMDYPAENSADGNGGMFLPSIPLPRSLYLRRIGRGFVLKESRDPDSGEIRIERMVGVCWPMLLLTYFLIGFVTLFVYSVALPRLGWMWWVVGLGLLTLVFYSLFLVACSDPGIFPRYSDPQETNWRWSSKAQSYRPPGVVYCSENRFLVKDIDHFCPWTGTTIAHKNLCAFRVFVGSLCGLLVFLALVALYSSVNLPPGTTG